MTTYGYIRISTREQSLERQERNIIAEYPGAKIVKEVYTGTSMNRVKWNELLYKVKEGDTIVFDSVSRMSRTSAEGVQVYKELYNRGVNLVFLKEHHIDTDTYKQTLQNSIGMTGTEVDCILEGINKYLMLLAEKQIALAFDQAEKEVTDLRQRTKEGMETARRNGKQIGQKEGSTLEVRKSFEAKIRILQDSKTFGGNLNDKDIQILANISRNTLYKYKRELKDEMTEMSLQGISQEDLVKAYKEKLNNFDKKYNK